ncbi:MAG: putative DEAD/DEAH box RNA helicase [Linnemannia gamsii]|nr:MAG: putative DEAD/DEAH box RNA helicase [Linnemannia gamsii]
MSESIGEWVKRDPNIVPETTVWSSEKPVYDWKTGYSKDSAESNPDLEKELFSTEFRINSGIHFQDYRSMKVSVKDGPLDLVPIVSFDDAGLDSIVLENVKRMEYTEPTPVQRNAIPILMQNYDLMACAQTGSGKTAAFLVPTISKLVAKIFKGQLSTVRRRPDQMFKGTPLVLIILPTRELAIQIFEEARRFTYKTPLRPVVIYGGAESRVQKEQIMKGCDILIATPGRLKDMVERGVVSLARVRVAILDEADRMLDMGFEPQIRQIMMSSDLARDEGRQTLMFSATFPKDIQTLAREFLKEDFCRLRIGRIGGTTSLIKQNILSVEEYEKNEAIFKILLDFPPSRTLIFVETKRTADALDDFLYNKKFPTCSIHGDRDQRERELALRAFKDGKSPILIATAVASRGLDIKDVMHVINYDLNNDIDEYVHRIGRTARAGNSGTATTFYNSKNEPLAPTLAKLLVECKQEVPDFLQSYIDPSVTFETDDFHDEDAESAGYSVDADSGSALGGHEDSTWGSNQGQASENDTW